MSCSKHVQWEGYIQEVVVVDGSSSVFPSTVHHMHLVQGHSTMLG